MNKILRVTCGFGMPFAVAQGYSTTGGGVTKKPRKFRGWDLRRQTSIPVYQLGAQRIDAAVNKKRHGHENVRGSSKVESKDLAHRFCGTL